MHKDTKPNDTTITARTSVTKDIKDAGIYSGNLFSHQKASEWQKNAASFRKLNKLQKLVQKTHHKVTKKNSQESVVCTEFGLNHSWEKFIPALA